MARKVSATEILQHAREDDIWIVVNGRVYDVTAFTPAHPGGSESKLIDSNLHERTITDANSHLPIRRT